MNFNFLENIDVVNREICEKVLGRHTCKRSVLVIGKDYSPVISNYFSDFPPPSFWLNLHPNG
jgi:hypothetical protein